MVSTAPFWLYKSGFKNTSLEHWGKALHHYFPITKELDDANSSYTALIKFVIDKLHSQEVSVFNSLSFSLSRWKIILSWSLISGTVGGLVQSVEKLDFAARWVAKFIGVSWTLSTFFVLPILVYENISIRDGLRRSAQLFKKTWGERATANFTVGVFLGIVLFLIGIIFVVGSGYASIIIHDFPILLLGVLIFLVSSVILGLCYAASSVILQSMLYCYAAEGVVPQNVDKKLMDHLWMVK